MQCSIEESARLAALHRYNILDTGPEESFDRITRVAKALLQVPTVMVSLVDTDRQWFKSRQGLDAAETPRNISFCTFAIQQDTPLIISNPLEHPLFYKNPFVTGEPHIRFYIGVPLRMHDGHKIGTLCAFDKKPRELSIEQINAFRDLAKMVVDQIECRQIATTDGLTGALTRLGFDIRTTHEFERACRYKRELSLVAIDLDHFKKINDRYGHVAGDLVLKTTVATIKEELRNVDFIGRQGGEEFVIALPETDIDGAMKLAERVRMKIADTEVSLQGSGIRFTASLGVSGRYRTDKNWIQVFERADAALYEAKEEGRNRCVRRDVTSPMKLLA